MLDIMVGILIDGLFNSLTLILLSVGMVIVIGILRIINFAHGALYMVGSYGIWLLFAQHVFPVNNSYLCYIIALVCTIIFVAGLGLMIELLLRPLGGKFLESYIITLGLIFFLEGTMLISFGIDDKGVSSVFVGTIGTTGYSVPQERVAVIIISAVIGIIVWLFLTRTRLGLAMRAVANKKEGAMLQGIRIRHIGMIGMAIGSGLAAAAGGLLAPIYVINPYIGTGPVVMCFIVMVLGGIGSFQGAIMASFVVGFTEVISASFFGANIAKLLVYCLLLIALLVKPMGLYGGQEWVHH